MGKKEEGRGSAINRNINVKKLTNSNFYLNFLKFITVYNYEIWGTGWEII